MSIRTRYSKKKGIFTIKMEDGQFKLEAKVKIRKHKHLNKVRISVLKEFLIGMMHETLTGVTLVQEGRRRLFSEYCKARSSTLKYIDLLDKLEIYGKKKPAPSEYFA